MPLRMRFTMPVAVPASEDRPLSADRVPTLTEVVELGHQAGACASAEPPAPLRQAAFEPLPAMPAAVDMSELVSQVLSELAPRIDLLFEARLREALAPALARAADGLIRDTRHELLGTLRELVQEAVVRVIEQRKPR